MQKVSSTFIKKVVCFLQKIKDNYSIGYPKRTKNIMKILSDSQRRSYLWAKTDKKGEVLIPLDSTGLVVVRMSKTAMEEAGMIEYNKNVLGALKIFERSIKNFGATVEAEKLIKEALNDFQKES
jgi:hypothetical protein